MSTFLLTLAIAFIVVVIAIAFLAFGWLVTGKSKIRPGSCGRDPTKKRDDEDCSKSACNLCEREKKNDHL